MKEFNPIVWFEIYVDNMKRAKKFYESVLDLKLEEMPTPGDMEEEMEMVSFPGDMKKHGANGALVRMDGMKPGGNSTMIYFVSEDCSIEEARIEKSGGKVVQSKQSLGEHGFMCMAEDSEGNMFGVHSMK